MGDKLSVRFVEKDLMKKEVISFHVPRSKILAEDHEYFDKRMIWSLIKWKDTEDYPYEAIREDEEKGVIYQEIYEEIISEVNGIPNTLIEEEININNCFAFKYTPKENDRLMIASDYKYAKIKSVEQPHTRGFYYMSFTFRKGFWEIDKKIEKRVVKKSMKGIVEVK